MKKKDRKITQNVHEREYLSIILVVACSHRNDRSRLCEKKDPIIVLYTDDIHPICFLFLDLIDIPCEMDLWFYYLFILLPTSNIMRTIEGHRDLKSIIILTHTSTETNTHTHLQ